MCMAQAALSKECSKIAKGLAICCVILAHLGKPLGIPFVFQFGGIGVAVFLFLSGYGINESVSKNGVKHFWVKRFLSVFLVYFLFEACRLSMNGWSFSFGEFVGDICLISPRAPMTWYLNYLLIWYVLYYVGYLLTKIKIPLALTLGVAAVVLFFYFPHRLQSEQSFSFYLGVLCSMFRLNGKPVATWLTGIPSQVCIVGTGSILIFLLLIFKKINFADEECSLCYNAVSMAVKIVAIPVLLLLASWGKRLPVLHAMIGIAGIYSYELYLVHATTVSSLNASLASVSSFIVLTCALTYALHGLSSVCRRAIRSMAAHHACGGRVP